MKTTLNGNILSNEIIPVNVKWEVIRLDTFDKQSNSSLGKLNIDTNELSIPRYNLPDRVFTLYKGLGQPQSFTITGSDGKEYQTLLTVTKATIIDKWWWNLSLKIRYGSL